MKPEKKYSITEKILILVLLSRAISWLSVIFYRVTMIKKTSLISLKMYSFLKSVFLIYRQNLFHPLIYNKWNTHTPPANSEFIAGLLRRKRFILNLCWKVINYFISLFCPWCFCVWLNNKIWKELKTLQKCSILGNHFE